MKKKEPWTRVVHKWKRNALFYSVLRLWWRCRETGQQANCLVIFRVYLRFLSMAAWTRPTANILKARQAVTK